MKIRLRDGTGTMNLKFLVEDVDRHGNARLYFRRKGKKVRIRPQIGSDEFMAEYRALVRGDIAPARTEDSAPRQSVRWLVQRYCASGAFMALSPSTRRSRRGILDRLCAEHGNKRFGKMQTHHVARLRNDVADKPEAANGRVKALRQLFKWAIEEGWATENPAEGVSYLASNNPDGWHTWTVEEVRQFEAHYPIGTKARLALALLLFTGVRRSDAVKLGRQMAREGHLCFTETKGRKRVAKQRKILILQELQAVLDATPSGNLTYLVTEFGKPFTSNGFGNRLRKWCDAAGLPHCSAHGLRKAGATIAAENGATEYELMAIYGWETAKEAARYTRKVRREKLSDGAMHLLVPAQNRNESVPLSEAVASGGTKKVKKS